MSPDFAPSALAFTKKNNPVTLLLSPCDLGSVNQSIFSEVTKKNLAQIHETQMWCQSKASPFLYPPFFLGVTKVVPGCLGNPKGYLPQELSTVGRKNYIPERLTTVINLAHLFTAVGIHL